MKKLLFVTVMLLATFAMQAQVTNPTDDKSATPSEESSQLEAVTVEANEMGTNALVILNEPEEDLVILNESESSKDGLVILNEPAAKTDELVILNDPEDKVDELVILNEPEKK